MSEIAQQEGPPTVERPRVGVEIVCVKFRAAFGLMLEIATSKVAGGETA